MRREHEARHLAPFDGHRGRAAHLLRQRPPIATEASTAEKASVVNADDKHPEAVLWELARTLADLGDLTALWLEGEITYLPGYGNDRPDPETTQIMTALVAMNRAGFWTDCSQPGTEEQRAYVSGFCTEDTANAIRAATIDTELIVLAAPALLDRWTDVPITRDGGVEWTWGGCHSGAAAGDYAEHLPNAVEAITESHYVEVIDPRWGRNDLLWDVLVSGLRDRQPRLIKNHGQFQDNDEVPPGCVLVEPRPRTRG